eukprot:573469-Rhodomonas_salina.2
MRTAGEGVWDLALSGRSPSRRVMDRRRTFQLLASSSEPTPREGSAGAVVRRQHVCVRVACAVLCEPFWLVTGQCRHGGCMQVRKMEVFRTDPLTPSAEKTHIGT